MESLSSHLTTPHLDLLNPPVQRRTRVGISMGRDGPDFFTFGDGSIFFCQKLTQETSIVLQQLNRKSQNFTCFTYSTVAEYKNSINDVAQFYPSHAISIRRKVIADTYGRVLTSIRVTHGWVAFGWVQRLTAGFGLGCE